MRRLAVVLFFVLVGVASLGISAQLHLDTPIGREAGRRVLVELVSAEIAGSLDAEEVLSLAPDEAWVANVTIRDPDGRPVIVGERVHVRFDPWALLRGEVRFPLGEVIGGELVLYESESGLPTFVDAFGSSTPRAPDAPFEPGSVLAIVERLDIRDLRVRGTLLGVEGLEVEDVRARLALRIDDRIPEGFELRVDEADGRVVAPFGKELQLVSTSARVRDDASGTRLHARLRTGDGEELGVLLDYARPDGASATDGDDVLDLLLRLDPVRAETVAGSGLAPWAEPLVGEVRGHVRLRGPPDDLELRGWLRTEGGGVAVAGRLASDSDSEVTARTHALQLDRLVDGASSARVRGRARLALPVEGDPRVDADLDPFRLGELEVPASHLEGSLGEEQLNVDVLRVTTPGGTLEARGRVGFDGSVDLRVEGDVGQLADEPTLAGLVPGARGLARFEATLALDPDGALRADGRWVLTRFRYGPVYVGVLVATGRIDGNVRAPEVALRLGLRDVRVDERPLGDGTGRVEGGPTSYRVELDTQRDARRVGLGGRVVVDDGFRVDLSRVELAEGRLRWTGELTGLTSRGTVLSLERARLRSGNQRVEASGVWRRSRGEDAIELAANELDLGELRALLRGWVEGLPDVDGRVSGTASVGGDLERQPRLHVDATLADGRVGAVAGLDGSVLFQYADGLLVGDLGLTAAGSGELELDLRGTLDRDLRFRDALEYAAFHVDGRGRDLDLGLLQHLPFELPELRGRASGSGHADGGFDAFDFEANVDIPALQFELPESWREEGEPPLSPPLGFRGRVGYADGGLTLRGSFRDDGGQLAEAEASVLLDLLSTLEDPSLLPSLLDVAPWRLALRLPPRRVDRWPLALRRGIPSPESLLASATLTLRGGAYRPAGDLAANVAWVGPEIHACGSPSRPRVELLAHLENGATHFGLTGLVDDRRVVFGEADAATPVDAWLRAPESFALPSTRATLWAVELPLDRLPYVCQDVEGPITASIEIERLFGARPRLVAELSSDSLHVRQVSRDASGTTRIRSRSPALSTRAHAELGNGRANADVEMAWWNGGLTRATAGTALRWDEDVWLPEVPEDARLDGSAELVDTPLEAALLFVPQVSEAHGGLFGHVDVRGELRDPLLEGEIELRDGGLAIPALGQRLDDVEGMVLLEGRNLVLQRFEAHDGDGVASLAGDISLEGFAPRRADLALDADSFPVRQEGSVLARLTGQSRLGADFYEGGLQGTVVVDGLSVWLGDDAGRTPQSLAPHPDIVVLGRETADEEPAEPYSVSLHVDARRPFTIKGDDFAAELVAVLELGYVDALQLKGEVELRSGHFDIFGKRFDVERGALFFDGETDLDPSVNLVAVHELRSRSGETVTVTASGRLSEPVIRFTSSLTNDRAEIIALLVSGEVRGETAQDVERAPTDFLAGIAAGVLTLSLREEFGQVVPTIVVEGNTYGGTRIRGGWRLEDVLPESLRRVIRGVYIEGFFNTSGQDGEGSRRTVGQVQDYGFLLELALPRNVVNTNTFTPPNNFSLDVTWQP
ncbi:MAG: translocation/assembly module TamB domain-containing protein [Sandaracinus sp.]|nr:translocation/assembly module TamB domain-containing protein [Sandaracinus sp.]